MSMHQEGILLRSHKLILRNYLVLEGSLFSTYSAVNVARWLLHHATQINPSHDVSTATSASGRGGGYDTLNH